MLERLQLLIVNHVRDHLGLYVFLVVLFAAGAAFGALATGALDEHQRLELVHYLESFLAVVDGVDEAPPPTQVFQAALGSYMRTVGLIFLLGATVIGAVAVPVLVFLRGFILGFTTGFLLSHFSWTGLLITIFAVLPQSVLAIPAVLILAAAALTFALAVLRRYRHNGPSLWSTGGEFALFALLALSTVAVASLIEGYAAPGLLRIIAHWRQ